MMKTLRILLLLAFGVAAVPLQGQVLSNPASQPAQSGEYLIVSGGVTLGQWEKWKASPRDLWWMNFIRAARIRIQQLQAAGVSPKQITWFVYLPAYKSRSKQEGQDLVSNITSVRDAYGITLKFFDRTQQLIDYINGGKPRSQVKIVNFEYYGHSNKACLMFDYSNEIDSASKVWLHENEFHKLNRHAFSPGAFVKSWGCHSGESMSQKFRRATGIPMWGAIGKTQYMTHELPTLSASDGRWVY